MLKQRVILIVVAILLIVIIYNLPRIVVNNNPDIDLGEEEKAIIVSQGLKEDERVSELHSLELGSDDIRKINQFKIDFSQNSIEDRLAFADSIAILL